MNKNEINKRNEAIALFMEIPQIKVWGGGVIYDIERTKLPLSVQVSVNKEMGIGTRLLKYSPEQLIFHSSWDWLTPVLLKIGGFKLKKGYCLINLQNYEREYERDETIEAAFLCVSDYCLTLKKT